MKSVLVIDDQKDIADSVAVVLRQFGCAVNVAYSGADGLAAANATRPDVVLLDLGMPRMNGYEVATRLRHRWGSKIRLIAHSAWSDAIYKRRAEEAGFDQYLTKPTELAELKQAVNA